MNFQFVKISTENRIGYITLNRAEKKNALNDQFITELSQAFDLFETDDSAKVIVLRADGDVFSAGADLEYLQRLQNFSFEENLTDSLALKELLLKIAAHKKVVIAQVEGHAIAGGCGLASVCDFCFAVPDAKFGYTEVKIGFIPALVSVFLVRKIAETKARELLLTGKLISAKEAQQVGLINEVVGKKKIAVHVTDFATQLCEECSSQSLAATKKLLAEISDLDSALNLAARMNAQARSSEDCKSGIDAFLKKRKIKW